MDNLALIDLTLGTELVGGSEDMARELLQMLKDSLDEHQETIQSAFDKKDNAGLMAAAHKLHGACCYTGTPRLKEASKALELAAKKGEALDTAFEHFSRATNETRKALEDL